MYPCCGISYDTLTKLILHRNKLDRFVAVSHLQPSLIFASKAWDELNGASNRAPFKGRLLAFSTNIRQGKK
jgi:hypothetical protein